MEQKPAVVMPPCPAPTRSVTTASSAVYPSNVNGFPLEAEELMAMVSEITNGSVIDDDVKSGEFMCQSVNKGFAGDEDEYFGGVTFYDIQAALVSILFSLFLF